MLFLPRGLLFIVIVGFMTFDAATALAVDDELRKTYFDDDFRKVYHCTLDRPQPVLNNGTFQYDPKKGTSKETLKIDQNLSVEVIREGCEYDTVSYIFHMKRPPPALAQSIIETYREALRLLTKLENIGKPHASLATFRESITKYIQIAASPRLDDELYVGDSFNKEISEKLSVSLDLASAPAKLIVIVYSGPY